MFSNLNSTLSFLRSDASLWVFFTLLVIVLQVLMLIFLGTRRREFCYFYYAIGAVNIFLFFLMFFLPGADVPLIFVQLISWVLVFTAWCVYFHKSTRLKYYFIWNDDEDQQLLAAYEQKVLFLLDTASAAHAASSFAYMPAQHVQAVILYPAAAYVCGLPESANLMNAYLCFLVPAKRSTPMRCASMICIMPRSSGAKWSRRWTPSLVRSCARLIRLASPFRRFRPCCLPSAKHTKPHFPRRPPHLIHHTRQLPSSLRPSPLRSPCPPPRRGLFSHLTQCRPPRLNPTLSRRQSGIASSAARRTVRRQNSVRSAVHSSLPDASSHCPFTAA